MYNPYYTQTDNSTLLIVFVIIVIIVIVLIASGIGVYFFTKPPEAIQGICPEKSYQFGSNQCCEEKPTDYDKDKKIYTKCSKVTPFPDPTVGSCKPTQYEYGSDKKCCDEKPTDYNWEKKYYLNCSKPSQKAPEPSQGKCSNGQYEYMSNKCCLVKPTNYDFTNKYYKDCSSPYEHPQFLFTNYEFVSIQGLNDLYCSKDNNGLIKCNQNGVTYDNERFRIERVVRDDKINSNDLIAIRNKTDNFTKYCSDTPNGIVCNSNTLGDMEKFKIVKNDNKYNLIGPRLNKKCSDQSDKIICNSDTNSNAEMFDIKSIIVFGDAPNPSDNVQPFVPSDDVQPFIPSDDVQPFIPSDDVQPFIPE